MYGAAGVGAGGHPFSFISGRGPPPGKTSGAKRKARRGGSARAPGKKAARILGTRELYGPAGDSFFSGHGEASSRRRTRISIARGESGSRGGAGRASAIGDDGVVS